MTESISPGSISLIPVLEVTDSEGNTRSHSLESPPVSIGRSSSCDVVLNSPFVSRKHAEVSMINGSWHIHDLGSTGGTKVAGKSIYEPRIIEHQVVVIGPFALRLIRPDDRVTRASIFIRLNERDDTGRDLAWQEFHQRYAPIIAGYAKARGARPYEVDDIVQEVMAGFFAASPKFIYDPQRGRFRGYLKTAVGRAIAACIKKKKVAGVSLDALPQDPADPDQVWDDVWDRELFAMAVDQARKHYNNNSTFRAFEMYAIEEREAEDVAAELGISVDSVYQAKKRLTEYLKKQVEAMENQR